MLRLRLNCTVMRPMPSPLTDVIESMPAMAENSRSSGVEIEAAIVAGLAPGKVVETAMGGKSTCGRAGTGRQKELADAADSHDRHRQQRRHYWTFDAQRRERHGACSATGMGCAFAGAGSSDR